MSGYYWMDEYPAWAALVPPIYRIMNEDYEIRKLTAMAQMLTVMAAEYHDTNFRSLASRVQCAAEILAECVKAIQDVQNGTLE